MRFIARPAGNRRSAWKASARQIAGGHHHLGQEKLFFAAATSIETDFKVTAGGGLVDAQAFYHMVLGLEGATGAAWETLG